MFQVDGRLQFKRSKLGLCLTGNRGQKHLIEGMATVIDVIVATMPYFYFGCNGFF